MSLVTLIFLSSYRKDTEPGSHTDNWDKPLHPIPAPKLQHTSLWHSGRNNFSSCSFWSPKPSWMPSLQKDPRGQQGWDAQVVFQWGQLVPQTLHNAESVWEGREERTDKIPWGIGTAVHPAPRSQRWACTHLKPQNCGLRGSFNDCLEFGTFPRVHLHILYCHLHVGRTWWEKSLCCMHSTGTSSPACWRRWSYSKGFTGQAI